MTCQNCHCGKFATATYDAMGDGLCLPALMCTGCGCLELDEDRMDEILALLPSPELRLLHGAALRDKVWHLLTREALLAHDAPRGWRACPTLRIATA